MKNVVAPSYPIAPRYDVALRDYVAQGVIEIFHEECLTGVAVVEETTLRDMGVDSMGMTFAQIEIETRFNIALPDPLVDAVYQDGDGSVADVISLILQVMTSHDARNSRGEPLRRHHHRLVKPDILGRDLTTRRRLGRSILPHPKL